MKLQAGVPIWMPEGESSPEFKLYLPFYPSKRLAPVNILTRYTLKQIWIPALMAAVVISFVVMLGTIGEKVQLLLEELPIAQITILDISRLSVYALPSMTGLILPVTFLMGIMLTFGRMAQTSELTAAKAAGIPLRRLVLPVVAMGATVSAACFLLLDQGQPWAFQQINQLLGSEMPLRVTLDAVPTGVMHEYGEWRVYIGRRDTDGTLHNVIVLQNKRDDIRTFYAQTARVETDNGTSLLVMEDVRLVVDDTQAPTVGSMSLPLPKLKSFTVESDRKAWTLSRLLREESSTAKSFQETQNTRTQIELLKLRMEIGERLAFPLMCLAVSIVGAPIGARAKRSGRSFTFASGVVILAAYFILRSILRDVPPPSLLSAVFIAQIPNLALMAAGGILLWRVDRV